MSSTDQTERAPGALTEPPAADEDDAPEARRPSDRLLVLAAVVAVLVPIAGGLMAAVGTRWYPVSDLAVIEAQTMDIPSHAPLVGVFSRFNFHHPGPAIFYLYAIPYRLLGPTGLLVGAALINAGAAVGMVLCLHRRGGRALLLLGTGAVLVLEVALAPYLVHPWNAYVAILPFALAILLAWGVWERDWWGLPALVAVVSFTVQTHLGYALVGGWLLASAAAWAVWSWVRGRRGDLASGEVGPPVPAGPRARVLVASIGAALVLWALPLVDQLTRAPGNLRLLVGHFASGEGPVLGWGGAAGVYARELGVAPPWLLFPEPVQPFIGGTEPGALWWLLPVVVAFGAAAWWAWRRGRVAALRLQVLVGGTVAVGFVSVARITGEAFPYIIRWLWVLGVFVWLSLLWAARPTTARPAVRRAVGILVPVALLALSLSGAVRAQRAPLPDAELSRAIAAIVEPTAAAARGRGTLLVLPEGGSWQEVQMGLYVELERRGVFTVVRDEDLFLFGEHRVAGGRPIDGRLVVAVNEGVTARRAKGAVPVAEHDPLSADERRQLDRFIVRWTRGLADVEAGRPVADPLTPDELALFSSYQGRGQLIAVYLDDGPLTAEDLAPPPAGS